MARKVPRGCRHPGEGRESVGVGPHLEPGRQRDLELCGHHDKDAQARHLLR